MKKVVVIGCPGAGKSTFARKLHTITDIPLYYLDMLWHKPDKTNISTELFDEKLSAILKNDNWIIDGNYQRTLEMRIIPCDTIFLLDYPVELCTESVKGRIGKKREDMPWIEEELDAEFKQWIEDFPQNGLPKIYMLLEQYKSGKTVVVFKSRAESENYLNQLAKSVR